MGVSVAHGGPSVTLVSQCHLGVHPSGTRGVLMAHGGPNVVWGSGDMWGSVPMSPGGSRCHMRVLMAYDGMGGGPNKMRVSL